MSRTINIKTIFIPLFIFTVSLVSGTLNSQIAHAQDGTPSPRGYTVTSTTEGQPLTAGSDIVYKVTYILPLKPVMYDVADMKTHWIKYNLGAQLDSPYAALGNWTCEAGLFMQGRNGDETLSYPDYITYSPLSSIGTLPECPEPAGVGSFNYNNQSLGAPLTPVDYFSQDEPDKTCSDIINNCVIRLTYTMNAKVNSSVPDGESILMKIDLSSNANSEITEDDYQTDPLNNYNVFFEQNPTTPISANLAAFTGASTFQTQVANPLVAGSVDQSPSPQTDQSGVKAPNTGAKNDASGYALALAGLTVLTILVAVVRIRKYQ